MELKSLRCIVSCLERVVVVRPTYALFCLGQFWEIHLPIPNWYLSTDMLIRFLFYLPPNQFHIYSPWIGLLKFFFFLSIYIFSPCTYILPYDYTSHFSNIYMQFKVFIFIFFRFHICSAIIASSTFFYSKTYLHL